MKRPGGTFRLPKQAAKWTIHEIQRWCRKQLCGAPPTAPVDPQSCLPLPWNQVKYHAGREIKLNTNFKGLIINGYFQMSHNGPMTASRQIRKSKQDAILDNISDYEIITIIEENSERFWKEIDELLDWYNQEDMKGRHTVEQMWRAGKKMQEIIDNANTDLEFEYITESNLYVSIEERGIGLRKKGYRKNQLYSSFQLYKWLPDANSDHPIMEHRPIPVGKLMRISREKPTRRMNLFKAYDCGPLKGVSDNQLGWALGFSKETFPVPDRWNDLQSLCEKIACGENLSEEELVNLQSILERAVI